MGFEHQHVYQLEIILYICASLVDCPCYYMSLIMSGGQSRCSCTVAQAMNKSSVLPPQRLQVNHLASVIVEHPLDLR